MAHMDESRGLRQACGQLLQNLIGNAVKCRHPDRPPVVTVTGEQRGPWVQIDVYDNGIGIPGEYHERIFTVFQRLHARDQYGGGGADDRAADRGMLRGAAVGLVGRGERQYVPSDAAGRDGLERRAGTQP